MKTCSNIKTHTPSPSGYIAWHEWALRKSRRHKQVRCSGCGLLAIWVRRDKSELDFGGDTYLMSMTD